MRLWIWLVSVFILGAASVVLGVSVGPASKILIWDMPTAYTATNYHTQTVQKFAESVNQCADGELKIVVHPGGSLFKGHEIKRAVETGQVPLGERILSVHANDNELFAFDSVPFVVGSFEDADRLWQIGRPMLIELLKRENLVLLYSVPWPPQGIYFAKSVESIDDIRGLKFRAYNASTARMAELAGMIPVQIEAAEMSQALATGVVSAFMASGSTGYDSKVWEHLNYFYDAKAWLPRNYVFANKAEYQALSDDAQDCLQSAAATATEVGTARAIKMSKWYIEQLKLNGMVVVPPGKRFKKELDEIGTRIANEWSLQTAPVGRAILDEYRASRAPD
jgi:TRAP-type C4-dicarboxylate transport system substrate-binding protein